MRAHKFAVGRAVRFSPDPGQTTAAPKESFTVIRLRGIPSHPAFPYDRVMPRSFAALLLLASPALAQVEAEPLSILKFADEVRLRLIVSVESDRKLLITRAKLLDGQDHAYELTTEPTGIEADSRDACTVGTLVQ